jgi:beta-phosphoglucomutase-like phosphatase (HAD superfamily)
MRHITAVLFDPVGTLAEFRAGAFEDMAVRLFGEPHAAASGSEAYWHVLDLIAAAERPLAAADRELLARMELEAVEEVEVYEDVVPALAELRSMNISLLMASSLSGAAVNRFLEKCALQEFFPAAWSRDTSAGVKGAPMARAVAASRIPPEQVMALVDTAGGVAVAKDIGVNSILMINDYDEGRRLAMHDPTGAIVSLHELPDAIRFVAEHANIPVSAGDQDA